MYSEDLKKEVLFLINDGVSVKEISEKYNISISIIYVWKKESNNEIENFETKEPIYKICKNIRKLFLDRNVEEALKLCEKYKYNVNIAVLYSSILYKIGCYEDALNVCNNPSFDNNMSIQEQKVKALIEMKNYNEAIKIITDDRFKNSPGIQSARKKIPFNVDDEVDNIKKVNELYTKIYLDIASLEEINNSDITPFKKTLLKILYYEKYKIPGVLNIIKAAKKEFASNKRKVDALNNLYQRLESKRIQILDYTLYSSYLKCNLVESMLEEERSKEKTVLEKEKIVVVSFKENEKGKKVSKNKSNKKNNKTVLIPKVARTSSIEEKVLKVKKNTNLDLSQIKIKDVFSKEVNEIQKFLYVEMNQSQSMDFINAWDKFSILIEKSIDDVHALSIFINLAIKVNRVCKYISINIDNMQEKRLKYVKPSNN